MMKKRSLLAPVFTFVQLLFFVGLGSASCPPLYTGLSGRCLSFLHDLELDWQSAETRCSLIGGRLAVLDDCGLLGAVARHIDNNDLGTPEGYWIGASDTGDEGNFTWNDNTTLSLRMPFWGTVNGNREPSGGMLQNCVGLDVNDRYFFHDIECGRLMAPLCETDTVATTIDSTSVPETTISQMTDSSVSSTITETSFQVSSTTESQGVNCPTGYSKISSQCFQFLNESSDTWNAARLRCSVDGGFLAIVSDCNLLGDIALHIKENALAPTNTAYWIGASDSDNEGIFRWVDDTLAPLRMPFWGITNDIPEPNGGVQQNCVALDPADDYFFHDYQCDMEMATICQADPLP